MKTREWIMVIFIVILIQFIVQGSAWIYGTNNSALGYISFAGTIVSIILAVLAIVYSYVQSITQQNSSNTISKQVDKLINVADRVDESKNELSVSLGKLYDVSENIDKTLSEQEKIHSTVKTIDSKVETLGKDVLEHLFLPQDKKADKSAPHFSIALLNGHNGMVVSSLLLYFGSKFDLEFEKVRDEMLPNALSVFDDKNEEDNDINFNKTIAFFDGHFMGTFHSFCAFGLAKDKKHSYELDAVFIQVCEEFLTNLDTEDKFLTEIIGELEQYTP